MPLPLGHVMIGLTMNEVLARGSTRLGWKSFIFIAALANLPDLDIAAGLLAYGNGCALHRGPTHSLVFALLTGVLVANLWRLWAVIPRMKWTACFLIILSHVVADLVLTRSPVSLFWPWEIHWATGFSGWGETLLPILFDAQKDGGIVLVCLLMMMIVRFTAILKERSLAGHHKGKY